MLFTVSIVAGALGSLLGLGGGFIIVPVLTLGFHLDIRLAIGTSIVAVAATSSAGASRNVSESITNLRVATFLAVATTIGAVSGALLAGVFDARFLFALFGIVLGVSGRADAPQAPRPCRARPGPVREQVGQSVELGAVRGLGRSTRPRGPAGAALGVLGRGPGL